MTRPSTDLVDKKICEMYQAGVHPKSITISLGLTNKWRVYWALRRVRERCQNLPIESLAKKQAKA